MNVAITIIKMIGGLVLLIYGMNLLSVNLKKLAGEKFESILKKATNNIFKGIFTGILITIALQSSSATTVMVVGFVNAGILKLKNSIPIIMGANIGTTITAQILRMANLGEDSFLSLISPSALAPLFLLFGLLCVKMSNKQKNKGIGQLLIGVGLLFTGLMTMVDTASTLSELPIFTTMLTKLSNPILGVFTGALITAVVQSSAAAVGVLQAISITGFTTFANTIPIILGQNIGTCCTSILSSIGASKNAKRAATVHLLFNIIGTTIFMVFIYAYQSLIGFSFWNEPIDMGGIANFHLIFNIISTILLLPCTGILEKLTMLIIKDKKSSIDDEENDNDYIAILNTLDQRIIEIPRVAMTRCIEVVIKMGELAQLNLKKTISLIDKYNLKRIEKIQEREDAIDKMDVKVANFLVQIGSLELSEQESKTVNTLLKIESEFEKVGDYAYKMAKIAESINEKELVFSQVAEKDIRIMYNITENIIYKTLKVVREKDVNIIVEIEALKKVSEDFRERYKLEHIERLKEGRCSVENGIAFIEILASFEKIISHCANIAISSLNIMNSKEYITKSDYINLMYNDEDEILEKNIDRYYNEYTMLEKDNKLKAS